MSCDIKNKLTSSKSWQILKLHSTNTQCTVQKAYGLLKALHFNHYNKHIIPEFSIRNEDAIRNRPLGHDQQPWSNIINT